MSFYPKAGKLILGTRMRRLSEYIISEINSAYQQKGIEFDASWFGIFYILNEHAQVSIRDIANELQTSHSAVSQLVSNLKKKSLLTTAPSESDARIQLVTLTEKGKELLTNIKPVWHSISQVFEELTERNADAGYLLRSLDAVEKAFVDNPLSDRIAKHL